MAANQPPPARPWFRLGSMVRPAPATTPTPEVQPQPAAPQPTLPVVRPAFTVPFRPPPAQAQPTQPQEPVPPPPPAAAATAAPPPAATSASVPSSPVIPITIAPSSSVPSSPVPKATISSTMLPVTSSSPVSSPPKPKIPSSSSVPSSPAPKPAPSSTLPTSPAPKAPVSSSVPKPAPSSSVPTSPTIKPATTFPTTTTTARVPTPVPSPKIIKPAAKTPPQSPKITPHAPPPSPLVLPPSQVKSDVAEAEHKIPLEVEQKNVLVQKTIEKPKATTSVTPNGKREVAKEVEKTKEKSTYKKFLDSEDGGVRVITIAGENKGAFMELGHFNYKKHDFEGNPQSLQNKSNPKAIKDGESGNDSSSNDEGKSKMKDKSNKTMAMSSPPMSAFMNSNVQGVNNSILHNCSCTHHDPGVHLAVSRKPAGGHGVHLKDHKNGQNS